MSVACAATLVREKKIFHKKKTPQRLFLSKQFVFNYFSWAVEHSSSSIRED